MTVFAVLLPFPQPLLVAEIKRVFPSDHMQITDTQWLVSSSETVLEITAKLKIADVNNKSAPSSGNAIVFAISSYYGRASNLIWDWIKSKLESPSHG